MSDELQLPALTKQPAIEGEVVIMFPMTYNGIDLSFEVPRAPFARAYEALERLREQESIKVYLGRPAPTPPPAATAPSTPAP